MVAASPVSRRWLFGPIPDLLLGCGGAYVLFVAGLTIVSNLSAAIAASIPFASVILGLLTNTPHYGATILRVYENRKSRRRYAVFAVHATLILAVLFVFGLENPWLGSLLITIYFSWSPWHFAGQNFGLSLMFLRLRGIAVDSWSRRLLYASYVLAFGLSFLTIHGLADGASQAPVPPVDSHSQFKFLSLGLGAVATPLRVLLGVAYVGVLAVLARRLLARATALDLLPSAMIIGAHAMWFTVPVLLEMAGLLSGRTALLSLVWVAIFHSVQYLWVTRYYVSKAGESTILSIYFGKVLLAGSAVTVLPPLVFSPDALGSVSYQSGLGILWFSIVNIHHFVLDGAIWKLRDGAVARVLLRAEKGDADPVEAAGAAGRWIRPVIWSVAAACAAVAFFGAYEFEFGYRRPMESQDVHRVALGAERLDWIGRENAGIYDNLALSLAMKIQRNEAPASSWKRVEAYYRRSIELRATARAWSGLATAYLEQARYSEALACVNSALALDANHLGSLLTLAEVLMRTEDFARADEVIQRAIAIKPDSSRARRMAVTLAARKAGKVRREANRPTGYRTSDPTLGAVP